MQHIMVTRAYITISRPKALPQKGRSGILGTIRSLYDLAPLVFWLIYFNVLKALFSHHDKMAIGGSQSWYMTIVYTVAFAPGLILLAFVARSIFRDFVHGPKTLARLIPRWRVAGWLTRRFRR